jgi:DHA1 family putative efflux transporter-like MFS transporter
MRDLKTDEQRNIIFALALSTASTGPQMIALSLLMPEISKAFNTPIPLLGQLNTIFSIVAIIISLAMGFLTLKYSSKGLLLTGVASLLIGVIGAALSPNYTIMFLCFILYGVGNGLALPVINLLVALFPSPQRTSAMGRIYSGRSITSIFATPIIGFLTSLYGWRVGYMGFGIPLILLATFMVYVSVPDQTQNNEHRSLTAGFKHILVNRSAMACLIGSSLSLVFLMSLMVFNGIYIRNELGLSLQLASLLMSLTFIAVAVGQVTSGSFVTRFGVKQTTYIATFVSGASLFAYFSLPLPLPLLFICSLTGTAAAGTTMTTMTTLALDQVTESRGTMMSLNSASMSLGSMIGSIVGSLAINSFGFTGFGLIMFTISIAATLVYHRWTEEPY